MNILKALIVAQFKSQSIGLQLLALKEYSQMYGSAPAVALAQTNPAYASEAQQVVDALNGDVKDAVALAAQAGGGIANIESEAEATLETQANALIAKAATNPLVAAMIEDIADAGIVSAVQAAAARYAPTSVNPPPAVL